MARPRRISPRFSVADHARLTAAAAAAGMTVTAWLHRAALRHLDAVPPASPPSPLASLAALSPGPPAHLGRTSATRFTPDQHAAVAERAKDCCLSVSAYIRVLVLGGTPIARRSEVRSAIVAVNRVGTNLNQLVKLANSGILLPPELLREIHAVRAEIGTLRQAFLAALRDESERKGGG
ncbi:MAG TPA: plasmid mobilization relaxosome protein MobC [Thermoanaerobaculia bacterium]|nr:plasmid mobilization relaxosome protein MobC [Thermoanaerobaculia bacterium]